MEATNPSAFTVNGLQGPKEFLLPRAVLPYKNVLRPDEGVLNAPQGYYSHIPILSREADGWEFQDFLIKSRPDKHYFFEDPRISGPLFDAAGKELYFLGGTDYSRHITGQDDLFVRNVMYPLEFKEGRLQPLAIDVATGKPKNAFYVSPTPKAMPEGWRAVDAKNGVFTQLDDGSVVVHTRFRVQPGDDAVYKSYSARFGDRVPVPKYSIQGFKFKSYEDFRAYDWDHAMDDLMSQTLGVAPMAAAEGRILPQARYVLKDNQLRDFFPQALRVPGQPLGMGNGARRVRVERRGRRLYASFNAKSSPHYVGDVPERLRGEGAYALKDGEVSYLAPDHQLGTFNDGTPNALNKRVYSGMMTLYDEGAMNLKAIYANVIQPIQPHQISGTGGMMDLNHAGYFMGDTLLPDPSNPGRYILRAYAGAADAHSESFDFDIPRLLGEMSPGSERWISGQVYRP